MRGKVGMSCIMLKRPQGVEIPRTTELQRRVESMPLKMLHSMCNTALESPASTHLEEKRIEYLLSLPKPGQESRLEMYEISTRICERKTGGAK